MKTSETTAEIIPALIAAQAEFLPISKTSEAHKYFYAPLDVVFSAIKPALIKNNLAVVQGFSYKDDGLFTTTQLFHSSGEWISNNLYLPAPKKDPQGYGAVATYGRRYSLLALLGLAPEDEDDDAASAMPEKTTELNGEKHVRTDRGWERAPEVASEAQAFVKELQGLRGLANITPKEAEALTGVKWTVSLPTIKLAGLADYMRDFIERKEANKLTSEEIKILQGELAA